MSSANAPASEFQLSILRWFLAICLVLMPQVVVAQEDTGENDDPPPIIYLPPSPAVETGPQSGVRELETFICRGAGSEPTCAGDIGIGENFLFNLTGGSDLFTFVLRTHETVVLRTRGDVDTQGELFDAGGLRLAHDDDSASGRNFRIRATLRPGRYFLSITGDAGAEGRYTLQTMRKKPALGRVTAISAFETVEGAFQRPGGVDIYAVDLSRAGELRIAVDGAVEYELKAAGGATSLGLASSSLGATLAPLTPGSYYLYVSRQEETADRYRLSLELR